MVKLFIKWGLISGILSILYTYTTMLSGLYGNKLIGWLNLVILVIAIILCIKEHYKKGVAKTYASGIAVGSLTGIISSIVYTLWYYIYLTGINPDILFDSMNTNAMREELRTEGLSDEEIKEVIKLMTVWISPGKQVVVILILNSIVSLLISMISAVITKSALQKLNVRTSYSKV